jgi:hypothetical protein
MPKELRNLKKRKGSASYAASPPDRATAQLIGSMQRLHLKHLAAAPPVVMPGDLFLASSSRPAPAFVDPANKRRDGGGTASRHCGKYA